MTAPVFEIKRFAVHDGDGIRTTVFLKGCPLSCVWCHNPEGLCRTPQLAYYDHKCIGCGECVKVCPSGAHTIENGVHALDRDKCTACGKCADVCLGNALTLYGKDMTVDELLPLLLEDRDFYESSNGGVTISGGECLLHADFCAALLKRLKEHGIHTAVDTCGFVSENVLDKVIPYTDVFLYDVKAYRDETHVRCTGQSNRVILKNLQYLNNAGKDVEIRFPYVPDYNDAETEDIARFLAKLPNITKIRVLPYHNLAGSKYRALDMGDSLPTRLPTDNEIEMAKAKMRILSGHKVVD